MRKKVLFAINTMGRAGAETALIELLQHLVDLNEFDLYLQLMIPCGELVERIPEGVTIVNKKIKPYSLYSWRGKLVGIQTLMKCCFHDFTLARLFKYLLTTMAEQIKSKKGVQVDKLLWRVFSTGTKTVNETFDLAVAYIEGASSYYVCDKVQAKKKVSFIHIDYEKAGYTKKMDQNTYLTMDKIYVVSNEVGEIFKRVYPLYGEKVTLFRNIINENKILTLANEFIPFDEKNTLNLLSVGRLHTQKGYDIAIEACAMIKKEINNMKWYVIGEGKERKNLEMKIKEYGLEDTFVLLGVKNNPYPYIRHCDIYVQPSRFEGKSIAIEEAKVLTKPIVASNCTGNKEQIESEYNGVLVDLNPNTLSKGIIRIIKDESHRNMLENNLQKKQINYLEDLDEFLVLMRENINVYRKSNEVTEMLYLTITLEGGMEASIGEV